MPGEQILTLQLEQVGALIINVWPLSLEDLVEALGLQGRPRHREVDKCDSRADVWWELHRGVTGGQEDGEGRGEINVLKTEAEALANYTLVMQFKPYYISQ